MQRQAVDKKEKAQRNEERWVKYEYKMKCNYTNKIIVVHVSESVASPALPVSVS